MSLLLPILYVTAAVLMFAFLLVITIEHRDGLPWARRMIALFAIGFLAGMLALVQLCRVADSMHQHAIAQAAASARASGAQQAQP